ncbi:mucin-2-like isoform X2 [Scylla paramamosain]|uniref:mucin-2-like isoform X2 n=1 Tax=Scylla paramamosain TaxID=85552 RepID=UPI003083ACEF
MSPLPLKPSAMPTPTAPPPPPTTPLCTAHPCPSCPPPRTLPPHPTVRQPAPPLTPWSSTSMTPCWEGAAYTTTTTGGTPTHTTTGTFYQTTPPPVRLPPFFPTTSTAPAPPTCPPATTTITTTTTTTPSGSVQAGTCWRPPPYSEVAAKPELYPVVVMRGGITEVNSVKSMGDTTSSGHLPHHHHHHHPPPFPYSHCHHYLYRSGSVSTPEGSQSSSYTCGAGQQAEGRGGIRVSSPGCVLAMASPASSVGPHASDVSSLPPTSPPSPPAPTSPTLPPSPATRELQDVLQKISQLPGATTPPTSHPSGSVLSRHAHYSPARSRTRRPLGASLSLEASAPSRPRSLPLNSSPLSSPPCLHDPPSPLLTTSASTPNLAACWPSPPPRRHLVASLVDGGSRVVSRPASEAPDSSLFTEGMWGREAGDHRFRWRPQDMGDRV